VSISHGHIGVGAFGFRIEMPPIQGANRSVDTTLLDSSQDAQYCDGKRLDGWSEGSGRRAVGSMIELRSRRAQTFQGSMTTGSRSGCATMGASCRSGRDEQGVDSSRQLV